MSIQASHLKDVDLDFEAVVLRDEAGATFQVQRSLAFDDQDRALGMDTFCLVSDSGASYYGGVERWAATDDGDLVLELSGEAADTLGVPARLALPLDAASLAVVVEHVPRLVGPPQGSPTV